MIKQVFTLSAAFLFIGSLWGQREKYVSVDTVQEVAISARWAKESVWSFGKEKSAMLLRFKNKNPNKVQIVYNLSFYRDGLKKFTSPNDTIIVASGRKNHPRLRGNGIVLQDGMTAEELCWEFGLLDISPFKKE
jgi:hypothetical protein